MKPSEVAVALTNAYQAQTPMFVWGPPGVGKSDVMRQVAKSLGVNMIDQRLSQMDPTDLKGIPYVDDEGRSQYAVPGFLPQVERDGEKGFLFLDELNTAAQSIQAAGYQLILDRRLGDYKLPDGWVCFAAGNRAEDRAIAIRMPTALGTRFGHIDFEVDKEEWKKWAHNAGIHHEIISFMNFRPNLLHDMDVKKRTFPTPRTWEMLNKHVPYVKPENEFDTYAAFVGEGAAGEFLAYRGMARELPTFEAIMAAPKKIPVPDKPGILYAVAGLMSAHVEMDIFDGIADYVFRLPVEYQTVFMTDAMAKCEEIEDHARFQEWAVENYDVII
jgi:hypothetical protein